MPRAFAVLLCLAIVVICPSAVLSQTTTPAGYGVAATADLYRGVEYVKLAKPKGPVVAHVAHVLPGAPVDLQVVNANDRISTSARELEATSSMCRRVHCIVGLNGDFHKQGTPAGGVIVDGRMLHSPDPARPQLTVTKDGRLVAGTFPWTGSLTGSGGPQLPLSTVNGAPPANGLAVFTPEYGPTTDASSRVELVVKASRVGALNHPTDLELVALRTGAGPIPANGAVLSGDGSAGEQLRDLWARRQAGGAPARLLVSSPIDAGVSLGAEPVVLRDGKRASPWRDPNVVNHRQPHTLVGWNKEGHVYLVAIDGRQPASEGMSMAESADFLLSLGATDAVNLDGGGGTTFVAGGSVWNRPSDNDPGRPGQFDERSATNAFVVMARPGAPLPPEAPPAPAAVTTPTSVQVQPLGAAPQQSDGEPDGSGTSPTTWPENPIAAGGDASAQFGRPLIGVGGQLATGELPIGPAAANSVSSRQGRVATPSDEAVDEEGSLVVQARSDLKDRDDKRPASGDYLQATLSLAAVLTNPVTPAGTTQNGSPNPLDALMAGAAAVAVLLVVTLAKRRSQRGLS